MENNIDKATATGIATLFAGSEKLRVLFAGTHDAIGTLAMIRSFEEICVTEPYCVIGNENKRTHKILSENAVCVYGKIQHLHIVGKFDLIVPSGITEKESIMNAIRLAPILADGTLVLLFAKSSGFWTECNMTLKTKLRRWAAMGTISLAHTNTPTTRR